MNGVDTNNHSTVFYGNSSFILGELARVDVPQELKGFLQQLSIRFENASKNLIELRVVHRDIVAFLSLYTDGRFDFSRAFDTNFFQKLREFNEGLSSTENKVQILQTGEDATISIKTQGEKPPFKNLQKTEEIRQIVYSLLNRSPEGKFENPTEQEFYNLVDTLRERIGDDIDFNSEIDRIMSLKDDFGTKIVLLQQSEILKPYLT